MDYSVECQGLTKRYGARPLFADLSFDLRAGERSWPDWPERRGQVNAAEAAGGPGGARRRDPSARRNARIGYVAQDDVFSSRTDRRQVVLPPLPTIRSRTTSAQPESRSR